MIVRLGVPSCKYDTFYCGRSGWCWGRVCKDFYINDGLSMSLQWEKNNNFIQIIFHVYFKSNLLFMF